MDSRAPNFAFDRPSRASRATCAPISSISPQIVASFS
jgi:hypothetical protein